jgi:hypothetical protein
MACHSLLIYAITTNLVYTLTLIDSPLVFTSRISTIILLQRFPVYQTSTQFQRTQGLAWCFSPGFGSGSGSGSVWWFC